jgi:hypothetical protein
MALMRASATVSAIAHGALIAWGVWSIAAPHPLDASKVEAIPVAMVKIDEVTAAPKVAPAPAPKPTPAPVSAPAPAAAAKPPAPQPAPAPAPPVAKAESQPAPAKPAAPVPPKPAPAKPATLAPAPAPTAVAALPAATPRPRVAPSPPAPAKPAKADEPFDIDKITAVLDRPSPPAQPRAAPSPPTPPKPAKADEPFDIDKITAVLDRPRPPSQPAPVAPSPAPPQPDGLALGSLIAASAADTHMTMSELDALRARLAQCWAPPPGWVDPSEVRVVVMISLNANGSVAGPPQVVEGPAGRYAQTAPESAVRAVLTCAPYALPAAKYQDWKQVKITFDPKAMATG